MNKYQPLHHKYRPKKFDELVGQDAIALTLKQAIISNKIAPAYLFNGPRGTGKTSSARIFARSLNCIETDSPNIHPCGNCELCKTISSGSALDVIEIDAASNTGVDNIRELIERSQFAPVIGRWKVYVIDECHMLSTAAFNALLKTLEEPPRKVVFILATTDPQRVLPTIISRCQRFDFRRISKIQLVNHLKLISSKEKIDIEDEAIEAIANYAQGGLRDAESMLDQLSLLTEPISKNSIWEILGLVPESEIIELVLSMYKKEPAKIIRTIRKLIESGKEPISILQGFASILRDLIIIISSPENISLCEISKDSLIRLESTCQKIDINEIYKWQSKLKGSEYQLRNSLEPSLWLEVIFLGLLEKHVENITQKVDKSEKRNFISEDNPINTSNLKNNYKENKNINMEKKDHEVKEELKESQESENELNKIWSKILNSLELPSTKMLLSQQAKLVRLTNELAEINVAQNWITMIQSRKVLIEQAISKSLNKDIKLSIISEGNVKLINLPEGGGEEEEEEENLAPEKIIKKNNQDTRNPHEQNIIKKNSQSSSTPNSPPIIRNTYQEKSENKKVEKLADFFNGEIIDFEN